MQILRKSIVIQLLLFVAFFIMAINIGVTHFMGDEWPWLSYVLLGIFGLFIIFGILIYRSTDSRTSIITKKELDLVKYLTYGYFGLYILQMILTSVLDSEDLINMSIIIIVGLLIGISGIGAYVLKRILG